jgi:hypothetical protein
VCEKDNNSRQAGTQKQKKFMGKEKKIGWAGKRCPFILLLCRYLSTLWFSGMDFEHSFGLLSSLPTLPLLGQETQVCLPQLK